MFVDVLLLSVSASLGLKERAIFFAINDSIDFLNDFPIS